MKSLKKVVSLVLALVLCFCLAVPTLAAPDYSYADVEKDQWYTNSVERWSTASLIQGYAGTDEFGTSDPITRGQVAVIMARLFGLTEAGSVAFSDVTDKDAYYYDAVLACANAGIINGIGGTADAKGLLQFQPNSNISREAAFKIVMDALLTDAEVKAYTDAVIADTLKGFSDGKAVSTWADEFVAAIVKTGAVNGRLAADGKSTELAPGEEITRAEFATILDRLIALYVDKDGNVSTYVPAKGSETTATAAYVVVNAANDDIVVETTTTEDGKTEVIIKQVIVAEDGTTTEKEVATVEVAAAEAKIEVVQGQEGAIEKTPKDVYTLTVTQHDPEASSTGTYLKNWAAEIEEKSGGAIDVVIYHGGTIAGPKDAIDAVLGGTVDIAWGAHNYYAGQFPMTEVFSLPCLDITSAVDGSEALWNFYQTTDYMDEEYSAFHVLNLHTNCQSTIATVDKKISAVSDIKGMMLRVLSSGPQVTFIDNLGASAEGCAINDLYSNLDKGVFDGCVIDWDTMERFKLYETISYMLDENTGVSTHFLLMNQDSYAALPAELQQILDEVSADAAKYAVVWDECEDTVKAQEGVAEKLYTLSETERANLEAAAQATTDAWIEAMPEGQDVYDAAIKCIQDAKK